MTKRECEDLKSCVLDEMEVFATCHPHKLSRSKRSYAHHQSTIKRFNARKTKLNKKWQQGRSGEDFTSWAHSRAIYNLAEVV